MGKTPEGVSAPNHAGDVQKAIGDLNVAWPRTLQEFRKALDEIGRLRSRLATLEAENARLREDIAHIDPLRKALGLRENVRIFTVVRKAMDRMRAESKLRADLAHLRADAGHDSCAELAAENATLREELALDEKRTPE